MRYLKPHFYDQFTCTAGDCPDTCCAGWQIVIDEDSLERYGKEQGEFGKRLRNSIDWEEECFYQKNRRCAFLNDENLCDLYKALGRMRFAIRAVCTRDIRKNMRDCGSFLCPFPARRRRESFCPARSRCASLRRRPTRRMISKSSIS